MIKMTFLIVGIFAVPMAYYFWMGGWDTIQGRRHLKWRRSIRNPSCRRQTPQAKRRRRLPEAVILGHPPRASHEQRNPPRARLCEMLQHRYARSSGSAIEHGRLRA